MKTAMNSVSSKHALSVAALLLTSGLASAQLFPPAMQPLNPAASPPNSLILCISADGRVGAGMDRSGPHVEACQWPAGPAIQLIGNAAQGFDSSYAWAASGNGSTIVGTATTPSGMYGITWTAGGPSLLATLGLITGTYSEARGISRDGIIIVGDSDFRAVAWIPGIGIQELGPVPTSQSRAVAAADGNIIVGEWDGQGVRWLSGVMEFLPQWTGSITPQHPVDVSLSGDVIVGYGNSSGNDRAFRWTPPNGNNGGAHDLGLLPGASSSKPWGVTGDGTIVVGESGGQAFVWTQSLGMRRITDILFANGWDVTGLNLSVATDISDTGVASVVATNSMGEPTSYKINVFQCAANCDGSTVMPVLNVNDFVCFQNMVASGEPRGICTLAAPPGSVNQFVCFLNRFAAGCVTP